MNFSLKRIKFAFAFSERMHYLQKKIISVKSCFINCKNLTVKKILKSIINIGVGTCLSLSLMMLGSCATPKKVSYFQDLTEEAIVIPNTGELRIKPNDKLSITVKTMDSNLSALFNLPVVSDRLGDNASTMTTSNGNIKTTSAVASGLSKYTVSPNGTIDFPVLGELKVEGMTRYELAGFIKGELMGRDLAKDPVVTVEFVNMGVSMMGEVTHPGFYDLNNKDQITILEAITMAGDLTVLGQRENIAVIRETEDGVKTYRLDLTNFKEMSQSPAFYVQQGDVVYVEPNEMRKRQSTLNGNNVYSTSFWISVASLLTSITTTVGVFVLR